MAAAQDDSLRPYIFTCYFCKTNAVFTIKNNLMRHYKTLHNDTLFGRTRAGKESTITEKLYKCPFCPDGKERRRTGYFKHLKEKHADRKTFPCAYCKKSFYTKDSLSSHSISAHKSTV